MNPYVRAAALVVAVMLPCAPALANPQRPATPEDLTRIAYVSGATISHRGDRIAFVLTRVDAVSNRYLRNIWVVPAVGGEPRQLTRGDGDGDPQWSPDDRTIAFTGTRGTPAATQIYRIALDGGEARRLTAEAKGASSPRWSHDGTRLLYTATFVDAPVRTRFDEKAAGVTLDDKQRTSDIRVIDRLDFEDNGSGEIFDKHQHLVVIDAGGGRRTQITPSSPWSEVGATWSYDDRSVAFASLRRRVDPERIESDVYVVAAHGGALHRVSGAHRGNSAPAWSRDSQRLFVSVQSQADPAAMTGIDEQFVDGRPERRIVAENTVQFGDQLLTDMREGGAGCGPLPGPHDRWFLADVSVPGATALQRFDLASGKATTVVAGRGEIADCSMNDSGSLIAYTASDAAHPAEVYLYDGSRNTSRKLTRFNDGYLTQTRIVPAQQFVVRDEAGFPVHAWFLPADVPRGRRAPTLLEIHGGPGAEFGDSFFQEMQLLAGRGYNVVYANPRGSYGYGYAFSAALNKDWGDPMFRDETAVLDAVARRPDVDPQRLGVLGGSYGGYATLWMIGHTHRFKAAVAERVVSNMTSSFLACDECYGVSDVYSFGNAWANQDAYWRMSPIASIASVTTPLLLLHGDEDTRTPLVDSDQWFTLAKSLNQKISYVQVPRENHDFNRTGEPVHRIERLHLIADWFAKEL